MGRSPLLQVCKTTRISHPAPCPPLVHRTRLRPHHLHPRPRHPRLACASGTGRPGLAGLQHVGKSSDSEPRHAAAAAEVTSMHAATCLLHTLRPKSAHPLAAAHGCGPAGRHGPRPVTLATARAGRNALACPSALVKTRCVPH